MDHLEIAYNRFTNVCLLYFMLYTQDIDWKREWFSNIPLFPYPYWESSANRKLFLEKVARNFDVKEPRDWGRVTIQNIHELGGTSLLSYYNGSLFSCLQVIYQGFAWRCKLFICRY